MIGTVWRKAKYPLGIALMLLILFLMVPRTAFTEWLGIPTYQDKVIAGHNAVFWQIRANFLPNEGRKLGDARYGQIEGLTKKGELVLKLADGSSWNKIALPLAGIKLTDHYRVAVHLQGLKGITAKVDIYEEPRTEAPYSVVVWVHDKPVNLILVEDGLAAPEPQPVTSIMDAVYAAYYWRKAFGVQVKEDSGEIENMHQINEGLR